MEWTIDKYNLGDSEKHFAQWQKPMSKGYILYDSILLDVLRDKTVMMEQIGGCRDTD